MKNGVQMINDHRPVDTYYNGVKIAGSETKTFTGTSLSIADTYNDTFSALTLSGRYQQAEPSIDNPVYPTFSGDCTLTVGGDTVEIPALMKVSDYADEITISNGQVLHTEKTIKIPITSSNVSNFVAYTSGNAWYFGHMGVCWYSITPAMIADVGLCNYMTRVASTDIAYPINKATDNFAVTSNRLYLTLLRETLGLDSTETQADCVTAIRNWLISLYNAGNPFTYYAALETPTTTDITDTDLGQALLALRTVPYQTNISDNGVLPCDKTATLKVFGRTI